MTTDIATNRRSRSLERSAEDDKYSNDGIQELQLHQVPSEAPGMPATIEGSADIPPDGGYGWVCVACSFMVIILSTPGRQFPTDSEQDQ
jgi:hypothetical protein